MDGNGWVDIAYCADEETEILASDGWKRYSDLEVGEEVLTLNHETGLSEWEPVLDVCVFDPPPGGRELISMEGAEHSSLTTPNHRWPVERRMRSEGVKRERDTSGRFSARTAPPAPTLTTGWDRRFATTETLGYWDRIPVAAPCASIPTEAKYSDGLVELIAWFWTEGHIIKRKDGALSSSVSICQSHEKNPAYVARIDAALRAVLGPPSEGFPRRGSRTDGIPRWRRCTNGHKEEFYLSADAGAVVLEHAPDREVAHDFLRRLTQAQLELFLRISVAADGDGPRSLAQKSRVRAERFQYAATLAGYATSLREISPTSSTPYEMWHVQVLTKTHISPGPALNNPNASFRRERVLHDGIVWCPRTGNQTWLARRRGKTYFTGNTYVVCRHGDVYEGRGPGVRSAANGTNDGNARYYAVCVLMGPGDTLTDQAKRGFLHAREILMSNGAGPEIRPHRSFLATGCPGSTLASWIIAGCPIPQIIGEPGPELTSIRAPQPVAPQPPENDLEAIVATLATLDLRNAAAVPVRHYLADNLQGLLKGVQSAPCDPGAVDGVAGANTLRAVRNFQATKGLTADGIVGPNTWRALITH